MVVGPYGMTMETHRAGIAIPWEAVDHLRVRPRLGGRALWIRLRPDRMETIMVDGTPGTRTGVLRRGFLMLGSRGLHEDLDQVVAAIVDLSGGRVTLR